MEYLFRETQLRVRSVLEKYGAKEEQADDILADFLIVFTDRVQQGIFEQKTDAKLTTYTVSACKFIWWNQKKKKAPGDTIPLSELTNVGEDIEQLAEQIERDRRLQMAIDQLSERQQTIIRLRFWQNASWNEIADATGYSRKSMRHVGGRCLANLRNIWHKLND
ncbi:MAG: sigma-70 family RNA polymerase sigma factor [Bacteroidota bacterium]